MIDEQEADALKRAQAAGFHFAYCGVQVHYTYDECLERGWEVRFPPIWNRYDHLEGYTFKWFAGPEDKFGLKTYLQQKLSNEDRNRLKARIEGLR